MNLFTTSAGIVLIGVLTLSVTRPPLEATTAAPSTEVTLGVYDAEALGGCDLARIEAELPRIAREAGVDVIASERGLDYLEAEAEVVDVTARMLEELERPIPR